MPLIEVDATWEEAEKEFERKAIPAGIYTAQVIGAEITASQNGDPMVAWTFEITDDPEHNGTRLWLRTPTRGRGKYYLLEFAKACGRPWRGTSLNTDDYIGCRVRVDVSKDVNPKTGKDMNSVEKVYPL